MDATGQNGSVPLITTGTNNSANTNSYSFCKKFAFNFESTLLQFEKSKAQDYIVAHIKTWIHTLPWQFIYFYLTPKEFSDLQKNNHTVTVKKVKVKIINMGNRTPFVTAAKAVAYANANSQTSIGVYEKLEELGPFQCGNNIQHQDLYGYSYKYNDNYKAAGLTVGKLTDVHHHDHGAAQQPKFVDNRGSYIIHTHSKEQGIEIPLNDINFYMPPLIQQAKIIYNATNSIGPIYEKEYVPKDGTIHKFNNGLVHLGNVPRVQPQVTQLEIDNGTNVQPPLTRVGILTQSKYSETTIDNTSFVNLQGVPQTHVLHSLGIGVIPLINPDHKLEKAVLSIIVETYIELEGISHGTNLLMDYNIYPQPNTYYMALRTQNTHFNNIYGIGTLPIISRYTEGMQADIDDNPGIIPENRFSTAWGPGVEHTLKPDKIPGQRRVTGRMTFEERIEVFMHNLAARKEYIANMREQGTTIHIIENAENAQYAVPKGNGWNVPEKTNNFWEKLSKVGNKDYVLTEPDKTKIPRATTSQTSGYSGTTESSTHGHSDVHHPLPVYE